MLPTHMLLGRDCLNSFDKFYFVIQDHLLPTHMLLVPDCLNSFDELYEKEKSHTILTA